MGSLLNDALVTATLMVVKRAVCNVINRTYRLQLGDNTILETAFYQSRLQIYHFKSKFHYLYCLTLLKIIRIILLITPANKATK